MATQTTGGGSTTSFTNTPQANGDCYDKYEDFTGVALLDVMSNDLGGNAKILWSLDDGSGATTELLATDIGEVAATTDDESANGAKIWISNGKVAYDASTLDAGFRAALQALAVGEKAYDSFTYAIRLANGTLAWTTATIVYLGTNDAPVISIGGGDSAGDSLDETNAGLSTSGTLTVNDPDTSDVVNTAVTGVALSGTTGALTADDVDGMLTITGGADDLAANAGDSSNLSWAFNSGAVSFDYLAAGESLTLTYTLTSSDGNGGSDTQAVTITINGTNDGPAILAGGDLDGAIVEDGGTFNTSGSFGFTDVDASDAHSVSATSGGSGYLGTFTPTVDDDSTGDGGGTIGWIFSVNNAALQLLGKDETRTQTYTVTVDDGNGGTASETVTIVLTGVNDPVVVTSATQSGTRSEDNGAAVGGTITFGDVDLIDGHTASFAPAATNSTSLGTFTIDPAVTEAPNAANGSLGWSYTVNTLAAQYLAVGESVIEQFDVTISDGQGGSVTETRRTSARLSATIPARPSLKATSAYQPRER